MFNPIHGGRRRERRGGRGILTQRFEIFLALLNETLMQLNLVFSVFFPNDRSHLEQFFFFGEQYCLHFKIGFSFEVEFYFLVAFILQNCLHFWVVIIFLGCRQFH